MLATLDTVIPELEGLTLLADCSRRRVGAVITLGRDIVGRGSNSLPLGSCLGGDCPRGRMTYEEQPKDVGYAASGCTSIHAEVAAIREAGLLAGPGAALWVTEQPCPDCKEAIAESGIFRVIRVDLATQRVFLPVNV